MRRALLYLCLGLLVVTTVGSAKAGPKGDTIVDVVIQANSSGPYAGMFDTLIAALQAADPSVLATLSGNGQFTVFGPTDDAFSNLGLDDSNIGTVPQNVLTDILLYHVARGRRDAADVTTSSQIRTLYREFLSVSGAQLTDTQGRTANIIVTDVEAANGLIHVIDEVVLPFAI
jgi:uncharacterized surface protein with fasciclin (FAS1) repeats